MTPFIDLSVTDSKGEVHEFKDVPVLECALIHYDDALNEISLTVGAFMKVQLHNIYSNQTLSAISAVAICEWEEENERLENEWQRGRATKGEMIRAMEAAETWRQIREAARG